MDRENGSEDFDLPRWLTILDDHAGKVVVATWVLVVVVAIVPAFGFLVAAFPPVLIVLLLFGVFWWALGLWFPLALVAVAALSSVALALKWRVTAAVTGILLWTGLLSFGALSLFSTL